MDDDDVVFVSEMPSLRRGTTNNCPTSPPAQMEELPTELPPLNASHGPLPSPGPSSSSHVEPPPPPDTLEPLPTEKPESEDDSDSCVELDIPPPSAQLEELPTQLPILVDDDETPPPPPPPPDDMEMIPTQMPSSSHTDISTRDDQMETQQRSAGGNHRRHVQPDNTPACSPLPDDLEMLPTQFPDSTSVEEPHAENETTTNQRQPVSNHRRTISRQPAPDYSTVSKGNAQSTHEPAVAAPGNSRRHADSSVSRETPRRVEQLTPRKRRSQSVHPAHREKLSFLEPKSEALPLLNLSATQSSLPHRTNTHAAQSSGAARHLSRPTASPIALPRSSVRAPLDSARSVTDARFAAPTGMSSHRTSEKLVSRRNNHAASSRDNDGSRPIATGSLLRENNITWDARTRTWLRVDDGVPRPTGKHPVDHHNKPMVWDCVAAVWRSIDDPSSLKQSLTTAPHTAEKVTLKSVQDGKSRKRVAKPAEPPRNTVPVSVKNVERAGQNPTRPHVLKRHVPRVHASELTKLMLFHRNTATRPTGRAPHDSRGEKMEWDVYNGLWRSKSDPSETKESGESLIRNNPQMRLANEVECDGIEPTRSLDNTQPQRRARENEKRTGMGPSCSTEMPRKQVDVSRRIAQLESEDRTKAHDRQALIHDIFSSDGEPGASPKLKNKALNTSRSYCSNSSRSASSHRAKSRPATETSRGEREKDTTIHRNSRDANLRPSSTLTRNEDNSCRGRENEKRDVFSRLSPPNSRCNSRKPTRERDAYTPFRQQKERRDYNNRGGDAQSERRAQHIPIINLESDEEEEEEEQVIRRSHPPTATHLSSSGVRPTVQSPLSNHRSSSGVRPNVQSPPSNHRSRNDGFRNRHSGPSAHRSRSDDYRGRQEGPSTHRSRSDDYRGRQDAPSAHHSRSYSFRDGQGASNTHHSRNDDYRDRQNGLSTHRSRNDFHTGRNASKSNDGGRGIHRNSPNTHWNREGAGHSSNPRHGSTSNPSRNTFQFNSNSHGHPGSNRRHHQGHSRQSNYGARSNALRGQGLTGCAPKPRPKGRAPKDSRGVTMDWDKEHGQWYSANETMQPKQSSSAPNIPLPDFLASKREMFHRTAVPALLDGVSHLPEVVSEQPFLGARKTTYEINRDAGRLAQPYDPDRPSEGPRRHSPGPAPQAGNYPHDVRRRRRQKGTGGVRKTKLGNKLKKMVDERRRHR